MSGPRRAARVLSSLGLPLRARRNAWIASAAVLLYYLLTMSRDLSFYDSPELALVAVQGGLGHPPGQPLHTLLGWLFARIPGVGALWGLGLLSALPAALTVVALVSLAESLTGGEGELSGTGWLSASTLLPAGLALLALQPTLWENATRVEVYSLATFCATWAMARAAPLLTRGPGSASSAGSPPPGSSAPTRGGASRGWLAVGVSLGLSASSNPVIATTAGLALLPALVRALGRRRLGALDVAWLVGGGLLGLLPFAYLPLVAARAQVFVWGAPTGGAALGRYLTGADFAHHQGITAAQMADNLWRWLGWAWAHQLLPLLSVGLVASWPLGRGAGLGRGFGALALGGGLLMILQNVIFWPSIPDYQGYLALSVGVLGAAALAGLVRLAASGGRRRWLAAALGLALLPPVALAPPTPLERTRHRDRLARTLAAGALRTAPHRAVLIVDSDHWVFPLLYLQHAEGLRRDVVLLPVGLSGASWYWEQLFGSHGDLRRFDLRGPGRRAGRIRRFLEANPGRPVLYEHFGLALALGRRPGCAGAWLVAGGSACAAGQGGRQDELTPALAASFRVVGRGSPPAAAVAARVSLERGLLLWRFGRPGEALAALMAGVDPGHLPLLKSRDVSGAGALRGPSFRWQRRALIGHWARNLFVAARLLHAAGHDEDAAALLRAAARGGLPEARAGRR